MQRHRADMPGSAAAAPFKRFITCLCAGLYIPVNYDAEADHEGRYGCTQKPIWVHTRSNMGSCEHGVMSLESKAVSLRVTFVTIFSKTCNKINSDIHS